MLNYYNKLIETNFEQEFVIANNYSTMYISLDSNICRMIYVNIYFIFNF